MTTTGFDGNVRRKPPADWAWFAASFAFACVYWLVCSFAVSDRVWDQILLPYFATPDWPAVVIPLVPFLATLGLAFVFRVPDRSLFTWAMILLAAEVITGLASFLCLMVAVLLV